MEPEPFVLENYCSEILRAFDAGLYFLAAAGALALPDICSSLEWDPDPEKIKEQRRTQQDRYKDWFDTYVSKNYQYLTADDCYRLRCGLLHNGKMGRPQDQYDRVAFVLKYGGIEQLYRGNIVNGIDTGVLLALGLRQFCNFMIEGAKTWYQEKKCQPFVCENVVTLLKARPEGVPPYFVGAPALVGDTKKLPSFGNFAMVRIVPDEDHS